MIHTRSHWGEEGIFFSPGFRWDRRDRQSDRQTMFQRAASLCPAPNRWYNDEWVLAKVWTDEKLMIRKLVVHVSLTDSNFVALRLHCTFRLLVELWISWRKLLRHKYDWNIVVFLVCCAENKSKSHGTMSSLPRRHLWRAKSSSGDIYHQTFCFAATEQTRMNKYHKMNYKNKLSCPPSRLKSGKTRCNNSILFIISVFVSSWSKDKSHPSWPPRVTRGSHYVPGTICSPFRPNGTQRHRQGTNFLLPSWIRISFIFHHRAHS